MTDPKTLTDEQIDDVASRHGWCVLPEGGCGGILRATIRDVIALATREQTASVGAKPRVWWKTGEEGEFRMSPHVDGMEERYRAEGWLPTYDAAPVEQAGSPPLVNPAQPASEEKPFTVRSMTLPMLRMLLTDIPRPGEFGNRQSYVLASARYCETLAGWLAKAPADCDSEATSLEPGASEQDAKKGEQAGSTRCGGDGCRGCRGCWASAESPAERVALSTPDETRLLRFLCALHEHLPEDQRPMGWSDFSDEQAARARKAWRDVATPVTAPDETLREALDDQQRYRWFRDHWWFGHEDEDYPDLIHADTPLLFDAAVDRARALVTLTKPVSDSFIADLEAKANKS